MFLIITVVVLPTAMMLSWYHYTQNPHLRPLGITREALREYGVPGAGVEIVAYVDGPSGRNAQLASDLRASFGSKGVDVRLVFREAGGATRVTYVVGNSTLGPYSTARAAEGIAAAVEAYRMH